MKTCNKTETTYKNLFSIHNWTQNVNKFDVANTTSAEMEHHTIPNYSYEDYMVSVYSNDGI